jgi:DNA-binding response OmpR family regulator
MIQPDVLIIEDEFQLLGFLSEFLKSHGYFVAKALDTKEASEILKTSIPPLIISDINMPGKSGLQFISELRAQGLPCAVVMLTAYDDHERVSEAMRLGALDYVLKPFEPKSFIHNVGLWLEIGKRLQKLALEGDKKTIERQLRMIDFFRLKCHASNKKAS